jgi:hypothetical protein
MTFTTDIQAYHDTLTQSDQAICVVLATTLNKHLPDATSKIWHRHPVWFLEGNPIAGYSKLKNGIRLMFWSGASFKERLLKPGTGKFKDASILYQRAADVNVSEMQRWLEKSRRIQWDYGNIVRRKGRLVKIGNW